ncbi:hypothetical protein [Allosphingosinicella vermicomposti]|uniref:hypothetical protein n=1 Tax=Allosphingosinicella vermicomposti TaxID=614671 RepID=UPI000D0E5F78|nr:hypothetical protein [Allosphingosinicella vermicomposti]
MTVFVFLPAIFFAMMLALFWVPAGKRLRRGRKKAAAILLIAPVALFGMLAIVSPDFAVAVAAALLLPFIMLFGPPLLPA